MAGHESNSNTGARLWPGILRGQRGESPRDRRRGYGRYHLMLLICCRTGRAEMRQFGYTIIELMISITISLIILASLVSILANNSRTRGEIERANQQTENGRYALQLIVDDLHNAGFLAEF